MKEPSIEEKARAYDKVREKIAIRFGSNVADEIFSEYEEGEDERMRAMAIKAVHAPEAQSCIKSWGINPDDVIAWLEKQGKNNMGISEATKQKLENALNKALEKETPEYFNEFLEKQGELKSTDKVEPKFKVGDRIKKIGIGYESWVITDIDEMRNEYEGRYEEGYSTSLSFFEQDNFELVEQKPAWSEEDEKLIKNLISTLSNLYARNLIEKETKEKYTNFLKSLKDKVQPQSKQEWSEEDENMLQSVLWHVSNSVSNGKSQDFRCDLTEWLKSLRPQNTWEPSDEQMEALHSVIYIKELSYYGGLKDTLLSFYHQLKKLKEESNYGI